MVAMKLRWLAFWPPTHFYEKYKILKTSSDFFNFCPSNSPSSFLIVLLANWINRRWSISWSDRVKSSIMPRNLWVVNRDCSSCFRNRPRSRDWLCTNVWYLKFCISQSGIVISKNHQEIMLCQKSRSFFEFLTRSDIKRSFQVIRGHSGVIWGHILSLSSRC